MGLSEAGSSRTWRSLWLAARWEHRFLRATKWLELLIGLPDPQLDLPYFFKLHRPCARCGQFGPWMDRHDSISFVDAPKPMNHPVTISTQGLDRACYRGDLVGMLRQVLSGQFLRVSSLRLTSSL
jgi:hypothetical protein